MSQWDISFKAKLLEAESYRDFLRCFFSKGTWQRPRPLSFQEFANNSGLASKGFLADVIAGRKRLTPNSLPKVIVGLKLNREWANYLHFLVLAEEHSFDPRQKEPRKQHYLLRVGQIREKLTKSLVARKMNKTSPLISVILRPDFPETFAALGAEKTGASLDEIIARTRFDRAKVERLIDDLVHVGLAERDSRNKNVKPLALALEGFDLQNSDFFKKDFFRSLEKAKIRFEKQADSDGSLFMTQTFSVKGDQLPIFKRKLSDLVNDFASNAESDRGDTIAEICISFTNNKN